MLNQAPRNTQDAEFDEQFFLAFEIQVLQKALPAFEEASRFARDRGLRCSVELITNADGHPELSLSATQRNDLPDSCYRLIADPASQGVVHEEFTAVNRRTRRQGARLAALTSRSLELQLEAFFMHAFGMRLDYNVLRLDYSYEHASGLQAYSDAAGRRFGRWRNERSVGQFLQRMIYGNDERVEVAIIRALCATSCVFPRCRFAMNEFLVHFQDGHCLGKTVLRSFSRQMTLSEARVRLQACYPLRVPHLLNILHLTPMLPGR